MNILGWRCAKSGKRVSSAEDGHAPEDSEKDQLICKFEKVRFYLVYLQRNTYFVHNRQSNVLNKKFLQEFKKAYEYFTAKVLNALVKSTTLSLETLRTKYVEIFSFSINFSNKELLKVIHFFQTDVNEAELKACM